MDQVNQVKLGLNFIFAFVKKVSFIDEYYYIYQKKLNDKVFVTNCPVLQ